ncbi:MAG: F0F1 ATP synthase subunit B [Dehalococcoidia bacterium]|nr:F0F1 ATP synthase subunit B [Dehalococcoidia bacterium]
MDKLGFHWPSLVVYLVNFTILLGILYAVGYKPILRMLDQRSQRIRESLEQAERIQKESTERQAAMERQLQEARREGQALIEQARQAAEQYREEEREKARQQANAFVERARADIQRERDNAIEEVRSQFADLAITAAERVIRRSLDRDAHKELIDQVLEESGQFRKES